MSWGLYLPRLNHEAQAILASTEPKVILMKFIHGASKARVERQYRAGEAANCGDGGCARSDEADFERLVATAPAVNAGDTSSFVFTGKHVQVFANDRLIDEFDNPDLAYRLLGGVHRRPSAIAGASPSLAGAADHISTSPSTSCAAGIGLMPI